MNKRNLLLIIVTFVFTLVSAKLQPNSAYRAYISRYKDLAVEQMLLYKIPASITLAQGLIESGAGRSKLVRESNNHFGIKCHGWKGRKVYHDDDRRGECFRAYPSAYQSYEDHSKFLANSPRYRRLFSLKITDYKGWARGLKACGYATNPRYANMLIDVIETYELYQYDRVHKFDKFIVEKITHNEKVYEGTGHRIYRNNDNYYFIARDGDTFKSIAKEVDESYRKLAKYNERDKDDVLRAGDIVYLKKKKKKAEKKYRDYLHLVQPGESMYGISQKYGIRVKYLYKMNKLDPKTYTIQLGDRLRVR